MLMAFERNGICLTLTQLFVNAKSEAPKTLKHKNTKTRKPPNPTPKTSNSVIADRFPQKTKKEGPLRAPPDFMGKCFLCFCVFVFWCFGVFVVLRP